MKQFARRAATVAWPAFLGAGVLEMAVFAFVDPATLSLPGGEALDLSATTVYSVAFFMFWAVAAAACALTFLLVRGADEVNAEPLAGG